MDPTYNNRTYAVIPVAKTKLHVKANTFNGRLSLDKKNLIWDQAWEPIVKKNLKEDKDVKLLSHKEALELMNTPAWKNPNDPWLRQIPK